MRPDFFSAKTLLVAFIAATVVAAVNFGVILSAQEVALTLGGTSPRYQTGLIFLGAAISLAAVVEVVIQVAPPLKWHAKKTLFQIKGGSFPARRLFDISWMAIIVVLPALPLEIDERLPAGVAIAVMIAIGFRTLHLVTALMASVASGKSGVTIPN